jgi:hypothetical protein
MFLNYKFPLDKRIDIAYKMSYRQQVGNSNLLDMGSSLLYPIDTHNLVSILCNL